MRRRSRAGGGPIKTPRGKAVARKRGTGPKAARRHASTAIGSETEVARLTRELRESLEQQTATSEVLRVISTFPGDLEPVFETMLENAVRICEAKFGNIYRWDGHNLRMVATHNMAPAFADYRRRSPIMSKVPGRMVETKSVVHIADLAATRAYAERNPETVAAVELGGIRTTLAVPILKDNDHHDVTALEGGSKTLFEIGHERCCIHGAIQHEGRHHRTTAQAGDEGDRLPMPVRHMVGQPNATRAAAAKPHHGGVG